MGCLWFRSWCYYPPDTGNLPVNSHGSRRVVGALSGSSWPGLGVICLICGISGAVGAVAYRAILDRNSSELGRGIRPDNAEQQ